MSMERILLCARLGPNSWCWMTTIRNLRKETTERSCVDGRGWPSTATHTSKSCACGKILGVFSYVVLSAPLGTRRGCDVFVHSRINRTRHTWRRRGGGVGEEDSVHTHIYIYEYVCVYVYTYIYRYTYVYKYI